jgi:hypothetical protein
MYVCTHSHTHTHTLTYIWEWIMVSYGYICRYIYVCTYRKNTKHLQREDGMGGLVRP